MKTKKPKARRYPVPDGYPVAAHLIPDMPVDLFHMMHTGALMASDCAEWGWRPMRCADCQEMPLDMIYRHGPIPLEDFHGRRVLPGTVWGEDVTPICPRCSFRKLLSRPPAGNAEGEKDSVPEQEIANG